MHHEQPPVRLQMRANLHLVLEALSECCDYGVPQDTDVTKIRDRLQSIVLQPKFSIGGRSLAGKVRAGMFRCSPLLPQSVFPRPVSHSLNNARLDCASATFSASSRSPFHRSCAAPSLAIAHAGCASAAFSAASSLLTSCLVVLLGLI